MIKLLTVLILGYMIVIMCLAIHFKVDQDNPMMLLYPLIVAFYGWMAVVCREKWMFLPLFCSMGFEVVMGAARLMYVDVVTNSRQPLDANDPSIRMISGFYPGFVAEVQQHAHSGNWFRAREFLLFLNAAVVLFFTMIEIDLINRERHEGVYRNQMEVVQMHENADVVGPANPVQPPPSYEVVCADHTTCPVLPAICDVKTPSSQTDAPPSYGEVMRRRKEGGHHHHHLAPAQETCLHVQRAPLPHSCSTARVSATALDSSLASTARSTSSCSLRRMPSCATPSAFETGDFETEFETPTPLWH